VGLSNALEREMLREMGKVKLRKTELAAFIGVEKELQGARAKRDDKRKALNGCESVLGELVGALRKLELSVKLGCKPADLAEEVKRRLGEGGCLYIGADAHDTDDEDW
jgi:hypothetical protein